MSLEKVVANLIQRIENRYYGKYRGFVVDNADPEKLGRLRLTVPSVLGDEVITGWAMPCVPYGGQADQGFLFIPEVEAGVWVEFEEGDLEFPIWVGTFWSKPGGESELPKANGDVQDPPTQKIIKTKTGHTIQLEDADGEEKIIIRHMKDSYISIDKEGSVIIGNQKGSTVVLNAKDENMMLIEQHGNTVAMTEDGILVVNAEGNSVIELNKEGMAHVIGKDIVLEGTTVLLGKDAGIPPQNRTIAVNDTLKVLLNAFFLHVHPSGMGPTGPPNPMMPPLMENNGLTTSVFVK